MTRPYVNPTCNHLSAQIGNRFLVVVQHIRHGGAVCHSFREYASQMTSVSHSAACDNGNINCFGNKAG